MDILQGLFDNFLNQDLLIRFALIILIALYGLFALILVIQINNLNRTIKQIAFAPIFNLLAIIHFFAALALLLAAVLSL